MLFRTKIAGIDFASVITSAEHIATAVWLPQPVTLRGDEISITENDPEAVAVIGNESNIPADLELFYRGIRAEGSFIKASFAQLATMAGGSIAGGCYMHPLHKASVLTAVRFRLAGGHVIILPKAKGYIQLMADMGRDGTVKYPFVFHALAQPALEADLIMI